MTVIWGLDLKEMKWGKFKGSYMFSRAYYLRRTKMIVYQAAMIFCVVSESVGTVMLSDYVDQQDGISTRTQGQAQVQNNDIIGIASFNIFVGIAVATIFGGAFFFDLFWPERIETKAVRLWWKICAVTISILTLAAALTLTIIVAMHRAYIKGVPPEYARILFEENGPPSPIYRKNALSIASSVLLWLGVVSTFSSTYIMWRSHQHDDQFGPWSEGYKDEETAANM